MLFWCERSTGGLFHLGARAFISLRLSLAPSALTISYYHTHTAVTAAVHLEKQPRSNAAPALSPFCPQACQKQSSSFNKWQHLL